MEYSQDEDDCFLNTPITVIMDALLWALQVSKLTRATVELYGGEGLSGCMGGDRKTGVCDLHLMNCVLGRSVRGSKAGGDGMDGGGGTVVKMSMLLGLSISQVQTHSIVTVRKRVMV